MYEGEVFTFRSDRAPRPVARQQRSAVPETGRVESERITQLEAMVRKLDERLSHLTEVVQQLSESFEAQAAQRSFEQEAEPLPVRDAATKVSVQMIKSDVPEPPRTEQPDVKVTLFGGGATEAILGTVRITHE